MKAASASSPLLNEYYRFCEAGLILKDPAQILILEKLEQIFFALLTEQEKRNSFLGKFKKNTAIPGLYLWGGVGMGKTFLMDIFFNALAFKEKLRIHFHPFMQMIHQALKDDQGKKNPLQAIAKSLAQKYIVICLDEFIVTDIADAMLLRHLIKALIENGVCLVMTSNTEPDQLYQKGLQRPLFLPAIETLKQHLAIMEARSKADYRMQSLDEAGHIFYPT